MGVSWGSAPHRRKLTRWRVRRTVNQLNRVLGTENLGRAFTTQQIRDIVVVKQMLQRYLKESS